MPAHVHSAVNAELNDRHVGLGVHPAQHTPGPVIQAPIRVKRYAFVAKEVPHPLGEVDLARCGVVNLIESPRKAGKVVDGLWRGVSRQQRSVQEPVCRDREDRLRLRNLVAQRGEPPTPGVVLDGVHRGAMPGEDDRHPPSFRSGFSRFRHPSTLLYSLDLIPIASLRSETEFRADRHDARRVERPDRVISRLDVVEIDRLGDSWKRVNPLDIGRHCGIVGKLPDVALEQAVIGCIETDQRDKQPDIGLRQVIAEEEGATIRQAAFKGVQHREDVRYRFLIGRLAGREASFIDAVAKLLVYLLVQRVDFRTACLRIEIDSRVAESVERRIQHAQDVARLVVDDGLPFLVPEDRDRGAAGIEFLKSLQK